MTTVLIIGGVVVLIVGAYIVTHQWHGPAPTEPEVIENPAPVISGTVVPADPAPVPYGYAVMPGEVTLTADEVVTVFDLVAEAQRKNVAETESSYRRALPLDAYIYQLGAGRSAAGELVVEVRALPSRYLENDRWKAGLIEVHDGGAQYFDATVNVDTKEVTQFYVHGEA